MLITKRVSKLLLFYSRPHSGATLECPLPQSLYAVHGLASHTQQQLCLGGILNLLRCKMSSIGTYSTLFMCVLSARY